MTKRKNLFLKHLSIFLNIYCIVFIFAFMFLRYYELPLGINFFLVLTNVAMIVLFLINSKGKNRFDSSWIMFLLIISWMWLTMLRVAFLAPYIVTIEKTSLNNMIVMTDCLFLLFLAYKNALNYAAFIAVYKWLCAIVCAFLILQVIMLSGFGVSIDYPFPFLKLTEENIYRASIYTYTSGYARYSSLFMEPSHFSQFIAPYLCLSLFGYKKYVRKNIYIAVFLSLCMLFSVSGTGIFVLAIIWLYYFIRKIHNPKVVAVGILVGVVAIIVVLSSTGLSTMVQEVFKGNSNKTAFRVTRGFIVFFQLPVFEQLFGIGYQCVSPASEYWGISEGLMVTNGHNEYLNNISSLLVSFGFAFFVIVLIMFFSLYRKSHSCMRALLIMVLAISISEATFDTLSLFFFSFVVIPMKEIKVRKKHIVKSNGETINALLN